MLVFELHELCWSVDFYSFLANFRVSGNFPETAWRAVHSRQAAHAFVHVLGS